MKSSILYQIAPLFPYFKFAIPIIFGYAIGKVYLSITKLVKSISN